MRSKKFRIFHGVGLALVTGALVVAIFIGVFYGVVGLRKYFENFIARSFVSKISNTGMVAPSQGSVVVSTSTPGGVVAPEENDFIYLSFTDLFSGFGWVNQSETTLHHDYGATAFTLPPLVSWEPFHGALVGSTQDYFYSTAPQLVLSGTTIQLPGMYKNGFVNISAKKFSSSWAVGVVVRDGSMYTGSIFLIPSTRVESGQPVFDNPVTSFTSSYEGTLGFGGTEKDWVAVYGAYEGKGFRFKNGAAEDISRFLGIRLMNGGFEPTILHADTSWYVANGDGGSSRFLKLFENAGGKISGVLDLTSTLPRDGSPKISFSGDSVYAKLDGDVWKLSDRGFDASKNYEVVSFNLLGYPAETRYVTIAQEAVEMGGGSIAWYVSTDGVTWSSVVPGNLEELGGQNGTRLLWKARVTPGSDPRYSVFLDRLRLDYRVKVIR